MTFAAFLELFGALWLVFTVVVGTADIMDVVLNRRLVPTIRSIIKAVKSLALRRTKEKIGE